MTIHINPETGEHGKCTATVKDCPYQKKGEDLDVVTHFRTVKEAISAGEELKELLYGSFGVVDKTDDVNTNDASIVKQEELSPEEIAKNHEFIKMLAGYDEADGHGNPVNDGDLMRSGIYSKTITDEEWLEKCDFRIKCFEDTHARGTNSSIGAAAIAEEQYNNFIKNDHLPSFVLRKLFDAEMRWRDDYQKTYNVPDSGYSNSFLRILQHPNLPTECLDELLDKSGDKLPIPALSFMPLNRLEKSNIYQKFIVDPDSVNEFVLESMEHHDQHPKLALLQNPNLPSEVIDNLLDKFIKEANEYPDDNIDYRLDIISSNRTLSTEQIHKLVANHKRINWKNLGKLIANPNISDEDLEFLMKSNNTLENFAIRLSSKFTEEKLNKVIDDFPDEMHPSDSFGYHWFIAPLQNPNATEETAKRVRDKFNKQVESVKDYDGDAWFERFTHLMEYGYGVKWSRLVEKRMMSPELLTKIAKLPPKKWATKRGLSEPSGRLLLDSPDLPFDVFKKLAKSSNRALVMTLGEMAKDPKTSKAKLDALSKNTTGFIRLAVKENPNTPMKTLLAMAEQNSEADENES